MHVPTDRVVRLAGLTDERLAVSLDPLPEGLPAVVRHRLASADGVVDDVLDALESVAIALFPSWLPSAHLITGRSDVDRRVVRQLAHELASTSGHFGSFLADLAEAAVAGRPSRRRFDAAIRARGLARVIADGYARSDTVVLLTPTDGAWSHDDQRRAAAACEWLAAHGRIGVWLSADAVPLVDRYPTWRLPIPDFVDTLVTDDVDQSRSATTIFPPLTGRPHPASVAEQTLERTLALHPWSTGRTWNQEYVSSALTPPIRVDLMWPAERCAVEIDGAEHRGSLKYAADRRRDNGLVLDGYAVLRFTNEEITDDPGRVLGVIERLLASRRHEEGNRS